jgi:NAD(P)-dependent dehydrogenase (short-subunit alcohol dehydrogenase family)
VLGKEWGSQMDTTGPERFTGKVAFVTGAASGIGRAAALAFARAGASVVVADVSEEGNQETARMIKQEGGRALAVRCDVTRVEDVKAALEKTVDAFGRLDVAFNNAGIEPRKPAPTADYDEEEWNRICPGYIETPMMDRFTGGTDEGRAKVISEEPIGRMGRADEIADAVLWLCSASFTVGHALIVDGGQTVQ